MAQRIYKNTEHLKHQYAFDEWRNVIHISKALDYINGKKCRYFLDEKQEYEIILRSGEKNQWHYAIKNDYFEWNGKKYLRDIVTESPQHYDAKLKIVGQKYFEFDDYKIPVKNCRLERRFGNSYFRADLIAEMESGEKIFIEIIKTSDTSKTKEKYIITNQLPTFKIWIDNEGNFINKKFDFIGNREIERIRDEYRGKSAEHREIYFSKKSAWQGFYDKKELFDREIEKYEEEINQEIQRYFERIQSRIKRRSLETKSITSEIRQTIRDCRILRNEEVQLCKEFKDRISDLQTETKKIIRDIRDNKIQEEKILAVKGLLKDYRLNNGY